MTRAFPVSLLCHFLVLATIVWFGSHVTRQVLPRQHNISVRLARLPQPRPEVARDEPVQPPLQEEDQIPEPVVQQERRETPAVVPEEPERRVVAETKEPEPAARRNDPAPDVSDAAAPVTQPETRAPQPVVGTDVAIPPRFAYYIDLLESRIARNWHPKQLGFREASARVCKIHFHVEQNGLITRETIVQSSGVPLMDRESLKAVRSVGHFMPLPRGLADNALGVTYTFTLTSGN
ncbi:TonB family protein [bacterium]|nr:TonB family protein [bacterium]MBU1073974.1 TonB family protein [bacterium]